MNCVEPRFAGIKKPTEKLLAGTALVLMLCLTASTVWAIGCGYSENDDDAYIGTDAILTANANKEAFSWYTNLIWKITPSVEYAVGLIGMSQEVMDGREGDM